MSLLNTGFEMSFVAASVVIFRLRCRGSLPDPTRNVPPYRGPSAAKAKPGIDKKGVADRAARPCRTARRDRQAAAASNSSRFLMITPQCSPVLIVHEI